MVLNNLFGMSGSGFKMGLAIATYDWMAAFTLIIVAVFLYSVVRNKIFTMPQIESKDMLNVSHDYGRVLVAIICFGQSY
jgi:signal peptidase I